MDSLVINYMGNNFSPGSCCNVFGNIILHTVLLSLDAWAASRNGNVSGPKNFPLYLVCLALVLICKMVHHAR